nr:unnamed protein product [Spirometra erinaceieuropaei]
MSVPGYASPTEFTGIFSAASACRPEYSSLRLRSTICSSSTIARAQCYDGSGLAAEHGLPQRRSHQRQPDYQHGQTGGHASTVTQHATLHSSSITFNGHQINTVDNFAYLGSTFSNISRIDDEVVYRIYKASQAFGQLRNSVWNRHGLQLNTRLKMHWAVIPTTLL